MPGLAHRGFFLTLEGLDGSGKSTQIKMLRDWLAARNVAHTITRQPGGTEVGDRIRALLLDSKSSGIAARTELAMMFADRAQAIDEVIAPALGAGQVVVCDRFTDSTEAYQGGGRGLGSELILALDRLLCGGLEPDLTLLLLPDLETSLARARRRNSRGAAGTGAEGGADENRFESEQFDFFVRVQAAYRAIAAREPVRVVVIDGDFTVEQVHRRLITVVAARLQSWQAASTMV